MSWVAGLLCLLFLLGGLRNRGKLEKLAQLPPSDEPPEPGVRFLLRGGVVLGTPSAARPRPMRAPRSSRSWN